MNIRDIRKVTRYILYNFTEELINKYENLYISFEFGESIFRGGYIYMSPDTDVETMEIKDFIEKGLGIKLKPILDKPTQEVMFVWGKFNCMIKLMNPTKCKLIRQKETTDNKVIEVKGEDITEVVKTVTKRYKKKVIVNTYKCSGGKEFTVESEEMVEV